MIKTLSPYSTNTAKTAEIMSRYRPIAPKPEAPVSPMSESPKIRQSPYLRKLWPQLQARPTRTRKRGRAGHVSSPAKNLSLHGFAHGVPLSNLAADSGSLENPTEAPSSLVTLPLLPCTPSAVAEIPEEKDLLLQLQGPSITKIIAPQPVRPVGSSISVGYISEDPSLTPAVQVPKKPEEVEEEMESEVLPAVISDSNNKVRMANSAYKEMVGQPECSWLDSMVNYDGKLGGSSCKRICESGVPVSSNGFSCWVRIEWGSHGKKNSINAFCDVIRLSCESKDYLFTWRFHTYNRDTSQSSCNA
ncbi:hypothetical protein Pint_08634 [Pistacia integerrima]|uniref:Uncharacterized protein n=1 Tax=Pistacia integerrima TaxID=434235 RepID=A0ACC0XUE2_9ROSI|nr:hypothetical protein Pint_08634 [Pistacia integerrima]